MALQRPARLVGADPLVVAVESEARQLGNPRLEAIDLGPGTRHRDRATEMARVADAVAGAERDDLVHVVEHRLLHAGGRGRTVLSLD